MRELIQICIAAKSRTEVKAGFAALILQELELQGMLSPCTWFFQILTVRVSCYQVPWKSVRGSGNKQASEDTKASLAGHY